MIKKLLIVGAVAVVGFTTFTAFEEKTDEQIIAEKLEAKKAEFSTTKQVECDERANTMALGMVDSLVAVKKAAMAPVSGTKPVTKPKGSTKPSTKPAPAPVPATKPAPTPVQEKKDKMSGGTKTEEKKDKIEGTSNTEKKKAKMNSGGGGK
jgi:outer membrane biosynthesis protein TonB